VVVWMKEQFVLAPNHSNHAKDVIASCLILKVWKALSSKVS